MNSASAAKASSSDRTGPRDHEYVPRNLAGFIQCEEAKMERTTRWIVFRCGSKSDDAGGDTILFLPQTAEH